MVHRYLLVLWQENEGEEEGAMEEEGKKRRSSSGIDIECEKRAHVNFYFRIFLVKLDRFHHDF